MTITRRRVLETFTASALTGAATAGLVAGDGGAVLRALSPITPARAQASVDELMVAGPLPEQWLGAEDAPVTIIEYISMTCGYCARFHNDVWPAFKAKYVETGKVRFIVREFPLDPLAMGAFMLIRCAGDDKFFPFVDVLFAQQPAWTRTNDPLTALFNISRQAGFSRESFDSCLSNQQLFENVKWVKTRAEEKFDVRSTPTFFVNGRIVRGVQSLEQFDQLLAPLLADG